MRRTLPITLILLVSAIFLSAQEEKPAATTVNSLKMDLREEGIVVQDSIVKKLKPINPLAPSKAAFYSAVFPGLGQIYNKRYWKVPIVYAALGTGIYAYTSFDSQYKEWRRIFKRRRAGFFDDEFITRIPPGDNRLEDLQNARQNDRDLALLVTIIIYTLNIVDANVDAHLKQFNISDDLSMDMDFQPYLEVNPITNDPNYGMALTFKF